MKTSKEFFEKLQSDEAFAKEVGEKVKAKIDAGEQDYKVIWIPIAEEYGYELTDEELDEVVEKASAELSDEELGKVSGGTSVGCITLTALTIMNTISLTAWSYHKLMDD